MHVSNHHIVLLKLTQCYVTTIIAIKPEKREEGFIITYTYSKEKKTETQEVVKLSRSHKKFLLLVHISLHKPLGT